MIKRFSTNFQVVLTSRVIMTLAVLIVSLLLSTVVSSQEQKPELAKAFESGDTTLAITILQKSIKQDKGYYANYYFLGMIYFNQNNYSDAVAQLEIAVKKKKKHWESVLHLGLSQYHLGLYDDAEKTFQTGYKKARDEKHLFEDGLGLVAMAREQYSDADRFFRSAIVAHPEIPEYHIHLGDANFFQGIPSLAISEYKKALEVDTAGLEVYYHWAEACLKMKDYTCAIEKLKIVLQKDSTHAPAWMRAGSIYFKAALSTRTRGERKQRFVDAIGSYKKYLELSNSAPDSNNVRVFFDLAMSYVNIYGFEDAAKYFNDVLSIPYEARDIYFFYGKSLWGIKKYEEAADAFLKHIAWAADQDEGTSRVKDDELYRLLGDSYYYRKPGKDFFSAIKYYRKSLDANPDQKRIVQNIAVAYHSTKSYAQAIEFYDIRIALGIDSSSASILKNAGSCALYIAKKEAGGDDGMDLDEEFEDEDGGDMVGSDSGIDPNLNYYEVAVNYYNEFLKHRPGDVKALLLVASTTLYQISDCAAGVAAYERLLAADPTNCDAKKAIGYAYFGGLCDKNYTKALKYLIEANSCMGNCVDEDLAIYVAQCFHLRAVDKSVAKQDANDDFKNAYKWYGKVLKCDPSHKIAKKGQDDTRFEFFDKSEG